MHMQYYYIIYIKKCLLSKISRIMFTKIHLRKLSANLFLSKTFSSKFRRIHGEYSELKHVMGRADLIDGTALIEHNSNIKELPIIIRNSLPPTDLVTHKTFEIIDHPFLEWKKQFESLQSLKEVFSLLSRSPKITPNIALAALEQIACLEECKGMLIAPGERSNEQFAKTAIVSKLKQLVVDSNSNQTMLIVLNSKIPCLEFHKPEVCNKLIMKAVNGELSIDQLCEFIKFLSAYKKYNYSSLCDKLWVQFLERYDEVNETNIMNIFSILSYLKVSKSFVLNILEEQLEKNYLKMKLHQVHMVLKILVADRSLSANSLKFLGHWLLKNIHILNEDFTTDALCKLIKLNYTDDKIDAALIKFLKFKGNKIECNIFFNVLLKYCVHFKKRNDFILHKCAEHFVKNHHYMNCDLITSFIYPFGYLNYDPIQISEFWVKVENILFDIFEEMKIDDVFKMILSFLYVGKNPQKLLSKIDNEEFIAKLDSQQVKNMLFVFKNISKENKQLNLSSSVTGTFPFQNSIQDESVRRLIENIKTEILNVAQNDSNNLIISHLANDLYLIDIFLPSKMIAINIHLAHDFCSDKTLIGPEVLKHRVLESLGYKVVDLEYSKLHDYYTSQQKCKLINYLQSILFHC